MAPRSRSGSHPGRALAALGVLLLIMFFSITGSQTFSPGNWHKQFKVGLGLDLSSGTQVVLQAATPNNTPPSAGSMQQAISVLENRVNGTGSSGAQVQQTGSNLLTVTVPGGTEQSVISELANTAKLAFRPVYLEAEYQVPVPTATASASPTAKASSSASPSATPSGTVTPKATASASAKASTQDESAALASPSATAKATPTPTASATPTTSVSATPSASATPTTAVSSASGDASLVNAATQTLFNKLVCTPGGTDAAWHATVGYTNDGDQWDKADDQIVSCDASGDKYVLGPATFQGADITSATSELDTTSSQWVVSITLNDAATKAWGTLTTNQFNTYYPDITTDADAAVLDSNAVVLGGDVQEAPQTDAALTAGTFEINGGGTTGFTEAQANQLTDLLKYGQLPLEFTTVDTESVSAQTGSSSLEAGLIAGVLGLALVIIYLFYYYRGLGFVSVSSLLLAALSAYLAVVILSRYQNFTMSLSAIAGLVVAIGITADSFIVYFERLRDEVRDGKTLRPAVEAGWKRARRTILVSDTVSFIAAILLYHFATSDVQGFAYTLGLTTIIDVVVVFLFTKPMVTILSGTKFFSSGHKWSGLDPERLGAKAKWRASTRRTVRTQRTSGQGLGGSSAGSSTSKEA